MVQVSNSTVLVDLLIENAKIYMAQVGSIFPFFLLLKGGSPMMIEEEIEEIINVQNDSEPEVDGIYRSVVYMRMDRDEDVIAVQPLAKHLVDTYHPDALAFVIPSFYRVTKNPNDDDIYALDKDPESITVLYATLYLANDTIGYLRVIPYTILGEELSMEKIEKGLKHKIAFVDYNWTTVDSQMRGRFDNPFPAAV